MNGAAEHCLSEMTEGIRAGLVRPFHQVLVQIDKLALDSGQF